MSDKEKYHKKTVVQIVPALFSGGVERGTLEVGKALVKNGYKSIVISAGGPLVKKLVDEGSIHVEVNVATKNPFKIWSNAGKIAEVVKEYNVDIIHARSRAPAWSALLAAEATGKKFVTTFHGIYNFNNFIKKYYNSVMVRGDKVIAVSNFVKDHILKNYNIEPNKLTVIHRGVNPDDFSQDKIDSKILENFQEKYNVPKNTPVILLPARFTEWKGQMFLVEALEKIQDENFYCILVGDLSKHPQYVERVKERIFSNKLQSKIRIYGNEPDIRSLYGMADIVVSASIDPEAFGRTIIEAQSMEKLVIATGIGGAAETIEHGVSGFHVKPKDSDDLAGAIKKCLAMMSTEEAKKITTNARLAVCNNFSLDKMTSSVINIYESL